MNALALVCTNGNVLLYNLPVAIMNEQSIAKKRLSMGIESTLIHKFLTLVVNPNLDELAKLNRTTGAGRTHNITYNTDQTLMT